MSIENKIKRMIEIDKERKESEVLDPLKDTLEKEIYDKYLNNPKKRDGFLKKGIEAMSTKDQAEWLMTVFDMFKSALELADDGRATGFVDESDRKSRELIVNLFYWLYVMFENCGVPDIIDKKVIEIIYKKKGFEELLSILNILNYI